MVLSKSLRFALLLIAVGTSIGGYRLWTGRSSAAVGVASPRGQASRAVEITFLTTATKATWVDAEIGAFNQFNLGKYHATRLPLLESRDGMMAILAGKVKPTIYSPSNPIWIARLADVWQGNHPGPRIADLDDPEAFRSFLRSPLVVLTTKDKASFFRSLFSEPDGWQRICDLSAGRQAVPWGTFRFAHADPINANSGMLTMGLIIDEYARGHGGLAECASVVKTRGFKDYLADLDQSFVYDPESVGSSALEKAYVDNPATRDFITCYENKAMDSVHANPDLRVIYPNPTITTDQTAAVLNAPWVSPEQRAGGCALLSFLATAPSISNAVQYFHFRPVHPTSQITLAKQIKAEATGGFEQTYTEIELPPYSALNDAADAWRLNMKRKVGHP